MVEKVKKGSSQKIIAASIKKLSNDKNKSFDANKFCGALKIDDDALSLQRKLRNEWE